jgi:hypothetical protein
MALIPMVECDSGKYIEPEAPAVKLGMVLAMLAGPGTCSRRAGYEELRLPVDVEAPYSTGRNDFGGLGRVIHVGPIVLAGSG